MTTFLRVRVKTKLRHNVCDDTTVKEKCDVQYRAERYSLITVLNLIFFWVTNFLQINYISKTVFCDVNDVVTVIKQAFSIKSVNNDLSAA